MHDRVLAVDYGEKRIGLAVTDPLGLTAQPLPFLPRAGGWLESLKKVVLEKSVKLVLVGLPKSPDGGLGQKARECQNAAGRIRKELGVEVRLVDETFTSREAEDFLVEELDLSRGKRKAVRDSLSACLLLKSYLSRPEPRP